MRQSGGGLGNGLQPQSEVLAIHLARRTPGGIAINDHPILWLGHHSGHLVVSDQFRRLDYGPTPSMTQHAVPEVGFFGGRLSRLYSPILHCSVVPKRSNEDWYNGYRDGQDHDRDDDVKSEHVCPQAT